MSDPTWVTFCVSKPQPTHTKEELTKTTVFPSGATSADNPDQRIDYFRKSAEVRKARARAQKATG